MIVLFFIGRSSNPTSEYNFYENLFLYFLFLTNLFNVLAGTTPSLLRSQIVKKDSLAVDKTYDKSHRLHAMHCNIDLVVITTSSVYCYHKEKNNNKQTDKQNIKLSNQNKQMKKKKKKETKNISQGSNLGPLDVKSLA